MHRRFAQAAGLGGSQRQTPKLTTVAGFAQTARGQAHTDVRPSVPTTLGPAQQISRLLTYQSYYDNTLLEKAIIQQNPNDPIVASTIKSEQIPGYAIGLHPSSETPVAIVFEIGGQPSTGAALTLVPGQIVRPFGLPHETSNGSFSGFSWGLPFGWLGGGLATLVVFQSPDADVSWGGTKEIIFHRTRMQIKDLAALPANASKNWPIRFPWQQAVSGSSSFQQQGQPNLIVEPTRVVMRLRLASLAAAASMRIIFQSDQDFDVDSTGANITTPCPAVDKTWGTWASVGAGNLGTQHQMLSMDDRIFRLGADNGGVCLASSAATLIDQYVDVARYGKL